MLSIYLVMALIAFFVLLIQVDNYKCAINSVEDVLELRNSITSSRTLTKAGKFLSRTFLYTYYIFLAPTLLLWYIVKRLIPSILYKKESL